AARWFPARGGSNRLDLRRRFRGRLARPHVCFAVALLPSTRALRHAAILTKKSRTPCERASRAAPRAGSTAPAKAGLMTPVPNETASPVASGSPPSVISALRIAPADDVAVALRELAAGEQVRAGETDIRVAERIARGHKLALRDIAAGEAVLRYGSAIG